jgi:hypothetical protein
VTKVDSNRRAVTAIAMRSLLWTWFSLRRQP